MKFLNSIYFLMFPFFLFSGFVFFVMSFIFLNLNFSFMLNWYMFSFSYEISFPFYLDYMSCIFMGMVFFISGSIMYYSNFYMENEMYKSRFFFLMFLFVSSMVFLILCPNMFCMLLGWDGLGLISYCLVIYYQNYKSLISGMVTALTNRIGDVFILSSIYLFFFFGDWNYMNFLDLKSSFFFSLFFFLASLTKSAQVPFSAWLPAAMAAPTPVSSLVHSSTLVTAGVYILIRFNFFLSSDLKFFLMFLSLLTMIVSGISGLLEYDLKKIIALSTLSQLGFMMFTISLGFFELSFFHLVVHASFKAMMFMCAGIFIHNFFDNQDIRFFGIFSKDNIFCLSLFNVGNLSLCGFPFMSGFFSKDLILELVLMNELNFFFFFLVMLGTFLTVMYSVRLFMFLTFKGVFYYSPVSSKMKFWGIQVSMILLYLFSISLGYMGSVLWFFPFNYIILPFLMKVFILMICFLSFFSSFYFSKIYFFIMNKFIFFFGQLIFMMFLKTDLFKGLTFSSSSKISKSLLGELENFVGLSTSKSILFFSTLSSKSFFLNFLNYFMIFFLFFFFIIFVIF